jgi:hypothetical protein
MITEDYVSFEIAKLLKEKGFDEDCYTFYEYDSKELYREERIPCCNSRSDDYAAPTLQMAMKWLRETHKLFIEVHIEQGKKVSYKFIIWDFYIIHPNKYVGGTYDFREEQEGFSTPEDAVKAAIKYCLENLI